MEKSKKATFIGVVLLTLSFTTLLTSCGQKKAKTEASFFSFNAISAGTNSMTFVGAEDTKTGELTRVRLNDQGSAQFAQGSWRFHLISFDGTDLQSSDIYCGSSNTVDLGEEAITIKIDLTKDNCLSVKYQQEIQKIIETFGSSVAQDCSTTPAQSFQSEWKFNLTANTPQAMTLPVNTNLPYNFCVNWGDGSSSQFVSNSQSSLLTHLYEETSTDNYTYTIKIWGHISNWDMMNYATTIERDAIHSVFQVENVTFDSLAYAFADSKITEFNGNIPPMVTSIEGMFSNAAYLTYVDFLSTDGINITNTRDLFKNAASLEDVYMSSFNSTNVTDMSYMFSSTTSLTNLYQNFDVSNVTTMESMFQGSNLAGSIEFDVNCTADITNAELLSCSP